MCLISLFTGYFTLQLGLIQGKLRRILMGLNLKIPEPNAQSPQIAGTRVFSLLAFDMLSVL